MAESGGGHILNHASFTAMQSPPDYAVYAGAKSHVLAVSRALRKNLRPHQVYVSALCPGFFDSDFLKHAGHEPGFCMRTKEIETESTAGTGDQGELCRDICHSHQRIIFCGSSRIIRCFS